MTVQNVVIVGAGIGGLTLGVALARAGINFTIYERTDKIAEVGAGITMFPNSTKAIFSLGMRDELVELGQEFDRQSLWNFKTGERFKIYERGPKTWEEYGAPLYGVHRADLHRLLAGTVEKLAPGSIVLGSELTDVEYSEGGATAHFANGKSASGDLLVGCDGIKSRVRHILFGDSQPSFTGIVAWRALVPMEDVPQEILADSAGIHVGPRCNFSYYPIRNGTTLNYDAFAFADEWVEESWTIHSTVEELLEKFDDFLPIVKTIIRATPPDMLLKWGLFDRDASPRWSDGPVTLLGDAAHPMLPFTGQGSGIAIEDAVVLARILREGGDLSEALKRYEAARCERANLVMMKGRRNGLAFSTDPDVADHSEYEFEIDFNEYDAANVPV